MPAVAQISVDFARRSEITSTPTLLPTNVKSVNPLTLSQYLLYNRELPTDNFGVNSPANISYQGGFITAGDRINVKHNDLQLRQNLEVGRYVQTEFIVSRTKENNESYQNPRQNNTRSVTITPRVEDINASLPDNVYVRVGTEPNRNSIDLFTKRTANESSIRINNTSSDVSIVQKTDKFTLTAPTIQITGTSTHTGAVTVTGETTINNTVNIKDDLKIGTTAFNQFTVTGSTGAVAFEGNLSIKTDKFTVLSASGNTSIAGTLSVGSSLTVSGATTLSSTLNVSRNFVVGTSQFTVNSTNGDTTVAGTMDIRGVTTMGSNLEITGDINFKGTNPTYKITNLIAPTSDFQASNKKYVDDRDNTRLPLAGGTMTGFITLHADPTSNMHAVTKQYADSVIPTGAVCAFWRTSVPGWLLCNGSAIPITTETANLRNTVGPNTPDLRDYFIRGKSASRNLGSIQDDAQQRIQGAFILFGTEGAGGMEGAFYVDGSGGQRGIDHQPSPNPRIRFDSARQVRTASENRPQNVALNYFIKI